VEASPNRPELLRTFLAEADVPCPGCGYNLRGLTGQTCPECSQALALRVGLIDGQMRLYMTGLVGLAAGSGFSGLLLLYALVRTWLGGGPGGFWLLFVVITLVGALVESACLAAWLRLGRRLRRLPAGPRVGLAALAWVLTFANLGTFVLMIN
jgi:hypothetical protein